MAGCSQYAAAFGYDVYIVPVSACGVDLSTVKDGLKVGGFFDPTTTVPELTKISEGATDGEILAGDPGANVVYDGTTVTTESVFRLKGVTNASIETDTGTESVITYDTEGKGFDQSVAISKSWSMSLECVSTFGDAAYKALRLMEQNAVSGQLKCKVGRIGPNSTTETVYGYATITNFSESVEAGSIVSWSAELQGYGPVGLDLDNQNTINLVGPIKTLSIHLPGSVLEDGVYTDVTLSGGSGDGLATADITVYQNYVESIQLVDKGDNYAVGDDLTPDLPGYQIAGQIETIVIQDPGANIASDAPAEFYANVPIEGGPPVGGAVSITVANGIVTSVAVRDDDRGEGYSPNTSVIPTPAMPALPNPTYDEVLTITNLQSSGGFVDATYTDFATTTDSAEGSGLTLDIEVTGNTVTNVTINQGGSGYLPGDNITAAIADDGGVVAWAVEVDTVDTQELLTVQQPIFEVTEIRTGEAPHTDPTIRVIAIEGNDYGS
jgi:hypothetical protein